MATGVQLRYGNRKNKYLMHPGLPVLGPVGSKARLKTPTRSTNMSPECAKSDSLSAHPAKRTNVAQTSRWKIDSMTSPSLMHNSRRPVAPIPPHTCPPGGRRAGCCSLEDDGGVLPSSLRTRRGRGPRCFQRRAPVHHIFMRRSLQIAPQEISLTHGLLGTLPLPRLSSHGKNTRRRRV